ncbi:Aspartyl-tRNA(Asn) amidotransferase subunit A [Minicystis rosea]|nr:Aspartyl-tRNA(Asn) amidotransferase subunit A [Minicystis rosea]
MGSWSLGPSRDDIASSASPLRLSGRSLSAVRRLATLPGTGALVRAVVMEVLGIRDLARLPPEFRGELPDVLQPVRARAPRRWDDARLGAPSRDGFPHASRAYLDAYATRRTTPIEVAERALSALSQLQRRTPSMNVLAAHDPEAVRAAARIAADRFAQGSARPLEGVPFLVKDQHDVAGMPTRFGSGHDPAVAVADATVVARLRAAGAVVLGKSLMTEWGVSPIGNNVHAVMPRNPHVPTRAAGGSSTGSAVAVALGIGPFATGGDAGGSIRVPAAICGIFGIKPTFGRISRAGEAFGGSLNHLGGLAVGARDLALFLDAVASAPDPADPMTSWADPPPSGGFGARLGDGVRGLRIGVDEEDLRDCDPAIAAVHQSALRALERDGATLVPVRIPLARDAAAIGIATLGCEGVALAETVAPELTALLAPDVKLAMSVAARVSASEYLDLQRLRAGLRRQVAAALSIADVLVSPTVSSTAPSLSDRELNGSFSDADLVLSLTRHAFLANLTGLPAATAPIGVDAHGVPIGLQILGDAWDEASVLAVLAHVERSGLANVPRPAGAIDLVPHAPAIDPPASDAVSALRITTTSNEATNASWDVIVIGGGFTGVHCAAEIERRLPDARVLLLEASDRLGGRARSFEVPDTGCALDLGAHYLGNEHTRAVALARRLLRADQIYSHVEAYGPDPASRTYLEGRYRETTKKGSFLELQGLARDVGWDHRVRIFESLSGYLALEAAVDRREPWRTKDAAALDSITVQAWIDAQRVPRWIKQMWGLAVLDILSIRPAQISMLYWLWYNAANGGFLQVANDHRGGPQELGLTVGLEGLLMRHAAEIRGLVLRDMPVTDVLHDRPDRVIVLAPGGRFEARRVVVAVTPHAAGRHLRFDPDLSAARRLLHAQPIGHAAKAVFVYDTPWWKAPGGLQFMSYTAGAEASGIEWALDTSHPSGRQWSLSAFVSDRLIDAAQGDDAELRRLLCASMAEMCGDARAAQPKHLDVWDWRNHPWVGGGPNTCFAPGVLSAVGDVWNRPEAPHRRLYFAAAEYATEFPGYVEGALSSAELVAERVSADLAVDRGGERPAPSLQPADSHGRLRAGAMQAARTALYPAILAADVMRSLRGREPRL